MKAPALVLMLLISANQAMADTTLSGDTTITGRLGVGAVAPRATLEAQLSPNDAYALRVASANGANMLSLDNLGHLYIGAVNPQGGLDVVGTGDNGTTDLLLRAGNSTSTVLSSQLTFGMASTDTARHSIRTRHTSAQKDLNTIDFFLWNSTANTSALGSANVMSLQAISTANYVSVHISPFGSPNVDLEVSNGAVTGGGKIHRAAAFSSSSRGLKTDISYFDEAETQRGLADVMGLKHASFRYKSSKGEMPPMRGLIYEDAPESIRGVGRALVIDYRLLNLELALKTVNGQISDLESKISAIEKARRGRPK